MVRLIALRWGCRSTTNSESDYRMSTDIAFLNVRLAAVSRVPSGGLERTPGRDCAQGPFLSNCADEVSAVTSV